MTLRVGLERWEEAVGELSSLFPLHWEEVGLQVPLDINYRAYSELARSGGLLLFAVRAGDSLVGYWTMLLAPLLHSRSLRAAHTDMLFIHPEFRSGGAWRQLQQTVERELIVRGVKLWFVSDKMRKPLGLLLARSGFSPEETSYVKRL